MEGAPVVCSGGQSFGMLLAPLRHAGYAAELHFAVCWSQLLPHLAPATGGVSADKAATVIATDAALAAHGVGRAERAPAPAAVRVVAPERNTASRLMRQPCSARASHVQARVAYARRAVVAVVLGTAWGSGVVFDCKQGLVATSAHLWRTSPLSDSGRQSGAAIDAAGTASVRPELLRARAARIAAATVASPPASNAHTAYLHGLTCRVHMPSWKFRPASVDCAHC